MRVARRYRSDVLTQVARRRMRDLDEANAKRLEESRRKCASVDEFSRGTNAGYLEIALRRPRQSVF